MWMAVRTWCLVLCAMSAAASPAFAVEFGEKAPELEVTAWVQGAPINVADGAGKNVFLLAFVSTVKPECAAFVPRATKLHEKHKAKGLEVIAISTDSAADLKNFVAEHKVGFRVAVDEFHNTTAGYAGEAPSLPFAVLLDRAGAVVFRGDPDDTLERVVDDLMAGRFDLKKVLEVRRMKDEIREALKAKEYDNADGLAEKVLVLDPGDSYAFLRRCDAFQRKDDLAGFRAFVKTHAERTKDDPKGLSGLAWKLTNDGRVHWRDPETAILASRRAVEISKSGDADVLDTHAHVLFQLGLLDQAVAEQKKVVALNATDEDYKKRLTYYEACLAVRQKVQPPAPKKK